MKYELAQYTARGGRAVNQDRAAIVERDNAVLLVVADGLGGHRGGEIAAEILTQTLVRSFQTVRSEIIQRPSVFLALGILQAHQAILKRRKMGLDPRTTGVMCLVQNGYAYWAHVGDSRLYHFRHGGLMQRTHDHSTVEELRREGLVSEDEMRVHPQKGLLTKCIGGPSKPSIALGTETALACDDVLLLCSDGLWEALQPEELIKHLKLESLEESAEEMVYAAENKMGSRCDNLTIASLRWFEEAPSTLPLQGKTPTQLDDRVLMQAAAAARASMDAKKQPEKERDLAAEIKELEQYLRGRDPKSE